MAMNMMQHVHFQGVYQLKIKGNYQDALYKYEIETYAGTVLHKADPFAFYAEKPPHTASKVFELNGYHWHDQGYFYEKKNHMINRCLSMKFMQDLGKNKMERIYHIERWQKH